MRITENNKFLQGCHRQLLLWYVNLSGMFPGKFLGKSFLLVHVAVGLSLELYSNLSVMPSCRFAFDLSLHESRVTQDFNAKKYISWFDLLINLQDSLWKALNWATYTPSNNSWVEDITGGCCFRARPRSEWLKKAGSSAICFRILWVILQLSKFWARRLVDRCALLYLI